MKNMENNKKTAKHLEEVAKHHHVAAKHLEKAAKHHHEAAKHYEEGNPDKAHHSMLKAFAHSALAAEAQNENLKAMI
jgi:hypothetical protein